MNLWHIEYFQTFFICAFFELGNNRVKLQQNVCPTRRCRFSRSRILKNCWILHLCFSPRMREWTVESEKTWRRTWKERYRYFPCCPSGITIISHSDHHKSNYSSTVCAWGISWPAEPQQSIRIRNTKLISKVEQYNIDHCQRKNRGRDDPVWDFDEFVVVENMGFYALIPTIDF